MPIPEPALILAGFVLAHSAWSISDAADLLVPLAVVQQNGNRELMRFEADTQEEAIAHGKAKMATLGDDVDCWAFAREGVFRETAEGIDVISVDIGGKDIKTRLAIIQRFQPYRNKKKFRLLGDPEVVIDGVLQEQRTSQEMLKIIRRGVLQHSKVAPLWEGWHRQ